jgi:NAD(P)-dependent dehydrogenase (short-subunit alcohol dehydrogenase family)
VSYDLKGKNILITGASSGIGRQAALTYGMHSANIIALGRSQSGLEMLDDDLAKYNCNVSLIPFNLTQFDLIKDMEQKLSERIDHLDVLFLNAAVFGSLTPVTHITEVEWNETFAVNLTSNVIFLKLFEPYLKKTNQSQVLISTSEIINQKKPFWGLYSASKAALEQIAYSYAEEIQNTNIKVNLMDPGAVNTKLRLKAYPGEDKQKITQPSELSDFFKDILFNDKFTNGELIRYPDWLESKCI